MASSVFGSNSFLLKDTCIFTGDHFIENGYVLVEIGHIVDCGPGACLAIPDGISTISAQGQTVLPGLIDAHVHGFGGNPLCLEQSLRFGVTTVCDMHNDHNFIAQLKKLSTDPEGRTKYCDFKCAGVGATIKGGCPEPVVLLHGHNPRAMISGWPKLSDPSQVEGYVQQQIVQAGASHIKLFHELGDSIGMSLPRPPLEIQKSLVTAAHAHGIIAVGHAFSYAGAMDLLACGVDGLTHIFLDKPSHRRTQEGDELQINFAADPLSQKMLFDKAPRQSLGMGAPHASVENAYASTKALYEAGVPIIVGSDASGQARGTAYGLGVHIELHLLMHKIGMRPIEVLKAATSLTADRFGYHDRGRIRSGRGADLVLVRGDVREVLADRKTLCLPLRAVWREGLLASAWAEEHAARTS